MFAFCWAAGRSFARPRALIEQANIGRFELLRRQALSQVHRCETRSAVHLPRSPIFSPVSTAGCRCSPVSKHCVFYALPVGFLSITPGTFARRVGKSLAGLRFGADCARYPRRFDFSTDTQFSLLPCAESSRITEWSRRIKTSDAARRVPRMRSPVQTGPQNPAD